MNSQGWSKYTVTWPHPSQVGVTCRRTWLHAPNVQKEPAKVYESVTPTLPKFPLSVTDNGHGTLHVKDADDNVVSFISYNDGSNSGANDIPLEMALGFALKLVETFKA